MMHGFADGKAGRNALADNRVKLLKFPHFSLYLCKRHAAADVDADHIGKNLRTERGSKTDGSDFAGMYIRHHTYFAVGKSSVIAKPLDLCDCVNINTVFCCICVENNCRGCDSVDCFHV